MFERNALRRRVEILDPLRFVAAMSVVFYHYGFRGAAADGLTNISLPGVSHLAKYGYLGVEMFFMISGFIIAHSAHGRNPREFAIARVIRIYPGFVACMTLTALVLLWAAPGVSVSPIQWAANLIIYAPGLGQEYVDGVYWTLVVEITFYAWVALLLAVGLFDRYAMLIALAWLSGSLMNQLVVGSWQVEQLLITAYSGFFAIGLAIHELHRKRASKLGILVLAYAVALSVFQAIQRIPRLNATYAGDLSPWVVGGVVVASAALMLSVLLVRRVPVSRGVLLAVGGLTYPLYLLHQFIGYTIFNRFAGIVPTWPLVLVVVAAMLALSWAVWRWVERPAQKTLKALLSGTSPNPVK